MLQALELNGFKSFAERTRFDFPKGITVVVGPNGSGKSNVVDAVKWVLGAQSVKALRGKEMADVIFSGTPKRRASGAAEVSLVFDNRGSILGHDAEQVEITRRVYRSGESEYLLNRKQCRLRDLRDVLSGTGMAGGAYSIIEQGKVDALLQSSPADRRQIFEEAAGISRFKLKRQDAARRLERVQQNLLRLTDIVEELQSQLTKVRSQAGRARQYKDVHTRLRELQIQVAVADWHEATERLSQLQQASAAFREKIASLEQELETCTSQSRIHEQRVDELQSRVREATVEQASTRERINHCQTNRRGQQARITELALEAERVARQLLTLTTRADNSQRNLLDAQTELAKADASYRELQASTEQSQARFAEKEAQLEQLKSGQQAAEQQLSETERSLAQDQNHVELLAAKCETIQTQSQSGSQKLAELAATLQRLSTEFAASQKVQKAAQTEHDTAASVFKQSQTQLREDRRSLAQLHKQQAELQGKLTGARERSVVLAELEKRLDGLSAGAKEVLRRASDDPNGPYGSVRGVVADLLRVDADSAQMIELALGERAHQLVVTDAQRLAETLIDPAHKLPARTVFLRLDTPLPTNAVDRIDLSAEPGVMGRADQFVETDDDLQGLVRRLLGRHWFVDSLETALSLSLGIGRGLSFITVGGEIVGAEGIVAVGPRKQSGGMLSRRNELRALEEQVRTMQEELAQVQLRCAAMEEKITADDLALQKHADVHEQTRSNLHKAELTFAALAERHGRLETKLKAMRSERQDSTNQLQDLQTQLQACQQRIEEQGRAAEQLQVTVEELRTKRTEFKESLSAERSQSTEQQVKLAGAEQRRDGLVRQLEQLKRDGLERAQIRAETNERLAKSREQTLELNLKVLEQTSDIAEHYVRLEGLEALLQGLHGKQYQLQSGRREAADTAEQVRKQLLEVQQNSQKQELAIQQLENQRRTLSDRLREQHRLELAVVAKQHLAHGSAGESDTKSGNIAKTERAEIDREIAALQSKMQASGPVNLEAVEELDALEERFRTLAEQHDDLQTARVRLEQIVSQINTESRQLFLDTIDEVRTHFKELFANLFGGGEADILVESESGEDVLECGIEIVARPPGKQPRSISLLSGGERTLTCVALLLAIFKSRPSPFCILDEVDAALDEANIDRFVEVLKEFMGSTQFIVITHSKRTMTCSDTLYGVTMQESGISKRVSVRFEDVTNDGHIKPAALKRAA
ncbi:chromosome segregation protein SMC [Adhaeretor mobilis]|uniref:Chromosome partition protein Smc n=1 Tax=Adhaeretor mobilis TaxID=1930276 RepID=A0A517MSK8_9BACT|nr:chromosome segregation protein SMC [Adhaeretor mobilis]QDS97777.1 Chromosome partition protein Smc [Adhaeretor mobilis]